MSRLGAFSGVFNTKKRESHVFLSEDALLIAMNLTSFTKNSCYEIYSQLLPSLQVAFPTIPRLTIGGNMVPPFFPGFTILDLINLNSEKGDKESGESNTLDIYYDLFDNTTKTYKRIDLFEEYGESVITYLYNLIDYFQQKQRGAGRYEPNPTLDDEIRYIQNSRSKSIKIYVPKKYILKEGVEDDRTILIKLFFQKQEKRNDDRIMSQRGSPMITNIPSTEVGTQSAHRLTNDFQQESSQNTGSLIPPVEDGIDNPKNTVTAPLRTHWNATDKVWESGTTQVLARLITDVDAAPITNIVPPAAMGGLSNGDFYDTESTLYMGAFTTGLAVPLHMQNGNPNLVGPNIIECGEKKLEKVRCVNRSAKSFKAGEQVLLNYINGEWLVSSIGEATAADVVAEVLDWAFAKYIVNSDSFFKDKSYYELGDDDADQIARIFVRNILPTEYETVSKYMFYNSNFYKLNFVGEFETEIDYPLIKYNESQIGDMDRKRFHASTRYLISTIFDQLSPSQGGFIDPEITRKGLGGPVINIINPKDPYINNDSQGSVVFPFWGPVFTDGYRSLKNQFFDEDKITGNESQFFFADDDNVPSIENMDKKNVPAEITSKIIDSVDLFKKSDAEILFSEDANSYRTKFCYPPFYESQPASKAKISFMPLYDTLVGHTDVYSILAKIPDRNYHRYVYFLAFNFPTFTKTLFGSKFFVRYNYGDLSSQKPFENDCNSDYDFTKLTGLIDDEHIVNTINALGGLSNAGPAVPYDCFIKQQATNIPLGTPRYYRAVQAGAECVGVIAATATIKKFGGGQINFQTNQYFGLGTKNTSATQEGSVTILPIGPGVGWGFPGGVSERSEKQWGSANDEIDSFGTTALHCRVFDYWPEDQTFFDPRYFSILHFNPCGKATEPIENFGDKEDIRLVNPRNPLSKNIPEKFGSYVKYEIKGLTPEEIDDKYRSIASYDEIYLRSQGDNASFFSGKEFLTYGERPRYVDIEETSVDIREPTFDTVAFTFDQDERTLLNLDGQYYRGILASAGWEINSKTPFRPFTEWRINPIRRGQLLSGGDGRGFIYKYRAIGLNVSDHAFFKQGTKFKEKDEFEIGKGAVLRVTQVDDEGRILNFSLNKKTDLGLTLKLTNGIEPKLGTDFLPSDFTTTSLVRTESVWDELSKKCYRVTIPSPQENGESAVIEFYSGLVWDAFGQDKPPKEHGSITRLTLSSNRGERATEGVQDTSFQIESNSSGFYNAFFFFHNDITHTPPNDRPFMGGFLQYVNLTII